MEGNIFADLKKGAILESIISHALHVYSFDDVFVIQRQDGKWGVMNTKGDDIIPFGKYDLIEPYYMGLARIKVGDVKVGLMENEGKYKWGIINLSGEEVLKPEYSEIWQFHFKKRSKIRITKDGITGWLDLYDLAPYPYNIRTDANGCIMDEEYYDQLREDYRTDDISDAFEGDPDALWNID